MIQGAIDEQEGVAGERIYTFASKNTRGIHVSYRTVYWTKKDKTIDDSGWQQWLPAVSCTCPGANYHGSCWHRDAVAQYEYQQDWAKKHAEWAKKHDCAKPKINAEHHIARAREWLESSRKHDVHSLGEDDANHARSALRSAMYSTLNALEAK